MKLLRKTMWHLFSILGGDIKDLEEGLTVVLRGAMILLILGAASFIGLAFLDWAHILGRFGISVGWAILASTALPALGLLLLVFGYPVEFGAVAFFRGGRKFFSRLMKWLTLEIITGINLWFVSAKAEHMIGVVVLFLVIVLIAALLARASVWAMTAFLACTLLMGLLFYGGRDKVRDAITTRAENAWAAGKEKTARTWEGEKKPQEEKKENSGVIASVKVAILGYAVTHVASETAAVTLECGNEENFILPHNVRQMTFSVPPCRCSGDENFDCAKPLKLVNPEGHWQMRIGDPNANHNMPIPDRCELFFKYRSGRQPVGTKPGEWLDVGSGCGNPNKPIDITYIPEGAKEPLTLHTWNPDGIMFRNLTRFTIVVTLWQEG